MSLCCVYIFSAHLCHTYFLRGLLLMWYTLGIYVFILWLSDLNKKKKNAQFLLRAAYYVFGNGGSWLCASFV